MVARNKRYIVWFYLLNLMLAGFGTTGSRERALPSSIIACTAGVWSTASTGRVLSKCLARPEFRTHERRCNARRCYFAFFSSRRPRFSARSFAGYASTYRLPREDFFRACGRNLWRFIRLMILQAS